VIHGSCYGILTFPSRNQLSDEATIPALCSPELPLPYGSDESDFEFLSALRESNPSLRLCRPAHKPLCQAHIEIVGAGEGSRTLDILLGRQMLYQLSYTRMHRLSSGGTRTPVLRASLFFGVEFHHRLDAVLPTELPKTNSLVRLERFELSSLSAIGPQPIVYTVPPQTHKTFS
jgi:hypothetical protein